MKKLLLASCFALAAASLAKADHVGPGMVVPLNGPICDTEQQVREIAEAWKEFGQQAAIEVYQTWESTRSTMYPNEPACVVIPGGQAAGMTTDVFDVFTAPADVSTGFVEVTVLEFVIPTNPNRVFYALHVIVTEDRGA